MPTYEYVCEDCGYEMERFQSITARALRKCPGCGKRRLKRLLGAGAGVIFKGAGFYQTDYRSESYRKAEKSEKGGPDTEAAKTKAEEKSESAKPEKKAEPEAGGKSADKKKSA